MVGTRTENNIVQRAEANVTIFVDRNLNPPVFTQDIYGLFTIDEKDTLPVNVTTVLATDDDGVSFIGCSLMLCLLGILSSLL